MHFAGGEVPGKSQSHNHHPERDVRNKEAESVRPVFIYQGCGSTIDVTCKMVSSVLDAFSHKLLSVLKSRKVSW